jgi:hypothetical protein
MKQFYVLFVVMMLSGVGGALAAGSHAEGSHENHAPSQSDQALASPTVQLLLQPATDFEVGKTTQVVARLNASKDGKPLSFDDLKLAHTKKLHLLVVDPSLSDYHHLHPVAGKNAGEYLFDFTPLKKDRYRVWADVIPLATGKQEYVQADMGVAALEKPSIDKTTRMTSTVDGYRFALAFDGVPKVGSPLMATLTVSKNGKPFAALQPVMGAFAHVVGFTEDYRDVLHIHPIGEEPTLESQRGGSKLKFHIAPEKPGFVKFFAQVRIDGKDLFAPFGVTIAP